MNLSSETLLHLAIFTPLLTTGVILIAAENRNLREAVSLVGGALTFCLAVTLYRAFSPDEPIDVTWFELLPGLSLQFRLEPLGILFSLVASFLWVVTTIYSIGYMRGHGEANQTRFYCFFAIAIASVMGIAYAENLFTLFVFYEMLTLCTYPLVTHAGTEKAWKGGRVYLGILLSTSIIFFLPAMIVTWMLSGTLSFTPGGVFASDTSSASLSLLLLLFAFGIGKAALMPFHGWLPAAMVAPTPVSALLHAVAVVKAGVFAMLKICLFIFGLDTLQTLAVTQWLLYLAGLSILLASLVAMRQDNLKARLAYSTVSQLGYITLGALLATSAGVIGSTMHIATHAFGKITLFFCAGAILVASHKSDISQMRGLGRRMPITMVAFFIASLSIIGLPPTGGTWSKWYLITAALEGHQLLLMVVLMVSSLLNIAYLLPIPLRAFFPAPGGGTKGAVGRGETGLKEAPGASLIAILVTALCCVLLFLSPQPLYEWAGKILYGR